MAERAVDDAFVGRVWAGCGQSLAVRVGISTSRVAGDRPVGGSPQPIRGPLSVVIDAGGTAG
jgi:hypothetical protein